MTTILLKKIFLAPIRFYSRHISYLFSPRCRFYPSCSYYAERVIEEHGVIRGLLLSIIRLSKCHPLHRGGADPVPTKKSPFYTPCCNNHDSEQSTNLHEDLV